MRALRLGALALAATVSFAVHGRLEQRRDEFPRDSDLLYLPAPHQLERMSLGYREALADLIWIRALIFAGSHLGKVEPSWSARYFDGITALAPRFERAYVWGGIIPIYSGYAITREAIEQARRAYELGVRQYPESSRLLFHMGSLLINEIGSSSEYSDEEKREARTLATDCIRRSAAYGGDRLIRGFAATLISGTADRELAIEYYQSQLLQAGDNEQLRQTLLAKLEEAVGREATDKAATEWREFHDRRSRRAPHLPPELYALLFDE